MKIESDYEPVDISAQCNTGVEVLPSQNEPGPATPSAEPTGPHEDSQDSQAQTVAGLRTLRGLPFLIGPSDEIDELRCFVRLRGGDDAVTLPIDGDSATVPPKSEINTGETRDC